MTGYPDELERVRAEVPECSAQDTERALADPDAVVIDVREGDEWQLGHLPGAHHVSRGFLEMRIGKVARAEQAVILYCRSGIRSLFAADTLRRLGYPNVRSMAGGFEGWRQAGLQFEVPDVLAATDRERYSRHTLIPEIGDAGQARLGRARVAVVGAGGLGSPALYYLAAAGVGRLDVFDDDTIDRSNLQRQILHTDDRVGTPKVVSARRTLEALNPSIHIETHALRVSAENAREVLADSDVIVDGCDNFRTRYAVNDACVALRVPNVHGSVHRFEGQVSVFWPGKGPCYRCLHPEPPPSDLAPNCAEAGVLGVLPGTIGLLEATECLKILLGIGEPLVGRLLTYDALSASFREFRIPRNPQCPACGGGAS
eukprot:jgi/Undpi1/11732/HiC_scaffold_37.g14027.m1